MQSRGKCQIELGGQGKGSGNQGGKYPERSSMGGSHTRSPVPAQILMPVRFVAEGQQHSIADILVLDATWGTAKTGEKQARTLTCLRLRGMPVGTKESDTGEK
jgi:hypothetical protein